MQIFIFNIAGSRLRRYSSGVIYEKTYPKTIFKFNFNTPDWDASPTKIAVFSYRGENYHEPLDENNMCRVPEEVLLHGAFKVSVYGNGVMTNSVRVPVEEKKLSNATVYDEIIELIKTHTHDEYIEESEIEEVISGIDDVVLPKSISVTLYADKWEQAVDEGGGVVADTYKQVVTVDNAVITPNSKVDLQPNADQLCDFYDLGVALTTENDGGVITIYIVGDKPTKSYNIQATVTEVVIDSEVVTNE